MRKSIKTTSLKSLSDKWAAKKPQKPVTVKVYTYDKATGKLVPVKPAQATLAHVKDTLERVGPTPKLASNKKQPPLAPQPQSVISQVIEALSGAAADSMSENVDTTIVSVSSDNTVEAIQAEEVVDPVSAVPAIDYAEDNADSAPVSLDATPTPITKGIKAEFASGKKFDTNVVLKDIQDPTKVIGHYSINPQPTSRRAQTAAYVFTPVLDVPLTQLYGDNALGVFAKAINDADRLFSNNTNKLAIFASGQSSLDDASPAMKQIHQMLLYTNRVKRNRAENLLSKAIPAVPAFI